MSFLSDLFARRGTIQSASSDSYRVLELFGARIIEPTAFEPDAATYHGEYYYNAVVNALYRKVITRREPGKVVAHWQRVSN